MPNKVCFVSFHELGLKGHNRATFERRLQDNLNAALDAWRQRVGSDGAGAGAAAAADGALTGRAQRIAGRLTVAVYPGTDADECARVLALVPGVTSVAVAYKLGRDYDEICTVALRALREAAPTTPPYTFKVNARRSNTDFPLPSMELNCRLGAYLQEQTGAGVRMTAPDVTVNVTIVEGSTYIATTRTEGIGGLPTGSSGRVVSLLSTGIDSPVATWRLIKRGAVALGLHFSGRPATGDASERLVKEIGTVLARTGGLARIYTIPFGDIQREIAATVEPSLRVIMYRRLMLVIAQTLARSQNAKALVTGESLGQVASQTLDNIVATNQAVDLPVLRPLIGSDKQEIIAEARRIHTYDLSIQPIDDCCTLFMPRQPETHAKAPRVAASWALLDIEALTRRALETAEVTTYTTRFGTAKPLLRTARPADTDTTGESVHS